MPTRYQSVHEKGPKYSTTAESMLMILVDEQSTTGLQQSRSLGYRLYITHKFRKNKKQQLKRHCFFHDDNRNAIKKYT